MLRRQRHPFGPPPPGFGSAVRIDNSADGLTRTTVPPPTTSFTMMGWFYMVTDRNNFSSFLAYEVASNAIYVIQTLVDGTSLNLWNGAADFSAGSITVAQWTHLTMTVNGISSGGFLAYKNAILTITGDAVPIGPTTIQIGDDIDNNFFNGRCAHVKIWDRVLGVGEIQAEMRQAVPANGQGLNSFYPLCGPTAGQVALDYGYWRRALTTAGTLTFESGPPIPWGPPPTIQWAAIFADGGIDASGTLVVPASVLAASVTVERTASGAMVAPKATLAAALTIARTVSGALNVPAAILAASANHAIPVSGALQVPASTLAAALTIIRTAAGTLVVPAASLAGEISIVRSATGDLTVPVPVLAAEVDVESTAITLQGALAVPPAVLAATAARAVNVAGVALITPLSLAAQVALQRHVSGELVVPAARLAALILTGDASVVFIPTTAFGQLTAAADIQLGPTGSGDVIL